jgi:hypothetical protein
MLLTREQRTERAVWLIACAMALAMLDRGSGWEVRSQPGDFGLCCGERKLVPHELLRAIQRGEVKPEDYSKLVRELGIADLLLAPAVSAAPPRDQPDGIRTAPEPS